MNNLKRLLFFIMTISPLTTLSQNEHIQLVEEGRIWHTVNICPTDLVHPGDENYYEDCFGHSGVGFHHDFQLVGDTIIDGRVYKRLVEDGYGYVCALRQEGNQVFYPGSVRHFLANGCRLLRF